MISTIVSGGLKAVVWSLAVIGLAGLVLAGLIASLLGEWFHLWMAVVNGGGLVLGGLWMRRS
jgi:hypothetical protein